MLELIESKNVDALSFYVFVRVCIVLVCWLFVIISNLVDFWSGTSTAKAIGEPLQSSGFRRTVAKIGDYVKIMIFALMFDLLGGFLSFYVLPFASILVAIAIMSIEGRSVIENSRKKKAHAADVPEVVKQIVKAATAEQGLKILNDITKSLNATNRNTHS